MDESKKREDDEAKKNRRGRERENNGSGHMKTIGMEDIANPHPLHVRVPSLSYHSDCSRSTIRREQ